MRSIAQESRTAMAAVEAAVRKEAQAAAALQRQRSAAIISQWKSDTRAAEQEERARTRAAEALQRQRSAALIRISRQAEQERVRAARQADREIEQAAAASQRRRSAFFAGAAGGVTALIGVSAISEIRNAASAWIDYSSKLETTKIAFTTMLGSAQLAEAHLKELQQFALKTPFQFGELIDASQRMQALGFNAQQVIPILTDVGNAVAAAGGGSERLDRVVLALSQIQSKGKVMTQELNQLAESGIPAWRMMEEQLGKTRAELIKMVEQGQISSQVFLDAFQKFSQQNFGGLMEAQSKTFTGAMSNIKDALLQTSATAFAPLYERISETARELATLSTTSKEFQSNLTTAGNQVIHIWNGVAEAFYIVRDVIQIVAAVGIQVIGALTHTFLALASAVTGTLHYLEALGRFMAGDFKGAFESAASGQNALKSATDELTRAARSQFAVAEALGRIWTEAGVRARAAGIAMQTAAAVMGAMPQTGGSMTLSGGLQPGAARNVGIPRGAGGTGRGATAARESEGQRLLNDLMERYNTLQAKTNELTVAQIIHQKLYVEATDAAGNVTETLRKEFANINPEILASIKSYANLITVTQQNADVQKKIAEETERQRKEAREADEERVRLQGQVIEEVERQRDALRELQFGEKTRLQAVEEYIVRAAAEAEAVGGVTAKMRELFAILIQIAIKQDEIAAMETWKKVGEQIGFPKSVDLEGEEKSKELGIWDSAIAALEDRIGNLQEPMKAFHDAANLYVVGAFHGMAEAATDAVQAWILYGGSLGKALKQALAAELAAISARAAIQAALHAAYAIGSLAFGNFASAAKHGIAAAKFAAVAALTGIAARGLAVSAAGAQGGGATAGSAFQNATQGGSGSTRGQPTTVDVNRRVSAQPAVHVTVQLHGDIATSALETRVVNAVVKSLDLNDDRLTAGIQGAAQRGR